MARSPLAPRPRGAVEERGAPRPCRRKLRPSKEQPHPPHQKTKPPQNRRPRRTREGTQPSRIRPRGAVGERNAPRPRRQKLRPSKEQPHLLHQKTKPPQNSRPRRAREGTQPSHPSVPEGLGERSAPRPTPSENKALKSPPTRLIRKHNFRRTAVHGELKRARSPLASRPRGAVEERSAPRPRRRKLRPSKEQPHLLHQKTKPPQNSHPRRAREGVQPSRSPSPRGCRGAERPTPHAVGN